MTLAKGPRRRSHQKETVLKVIGQLRQQAGGAESGASLGGEGAITVYGRL